MPGLEAIEFALFGWVEIIRRPSGLPSIADILLHCREQPLWANSRLMQCSKRHLIRSPRRPEQAVRAGR
jgi:hypothetical protein